MEDKKTEHTEEEKTLQVAEARNMKAILELAKTPEKADKILKQVYGEIISRKYGLHEMSLTSLIQLMQQLEIKLPVKG